MGIEGEAVPPQAEYLQPPPQGAYPPQAYAPPPPYGAPGYAPPPPGYTYAPMAGQPQYAPAPGQPQYLQAPPAGYAVQPVVVNVPGPIIAPMGTAAPLPDQIRFREDTVVITCPHCGRAGPTRLSWTSGLFAWLIAGGICLFGCWLGCCLIPFCMDSCKDVEHYCSSCNRRVGTYRRAG